MKNKFPVLAVISRSGVAGGLSWRAHQHGSDGRGRIAIIDQEKFLYIPAMARLRVLFRAWGLNQAFGMLIWIRL